MPTWEIKKTFSLEYKLSVTHSANLHSAFYPPLGTCYSASSFRKIPVADIPHFTRGSPSHRPLCEIIGLIIANSHPIHPIEASESSRYLLPPVDSAHRPYAPLRTLANRMGSCGSCSPCTFQCNPRTVHDVVIVTERCTSIQLKTDLIFFQHFAEARIAFADPPIKFWNTHIVLTEQKSHLLLLFNNLHNTSRNGTGNKYCRRC